MDHMSIWINNNQLIDRIGKENVMDIQNSIIDGVFGGFDNMLKLIMKDFNKMTYTMHDKLHQILLAKHDDCGDANDYKTANDQSSISALSDDSLSNILSYCSNKDLFTIKQTCRLFAVISAKPILDRKLWKLSFNKPSIINDILSDSIMMKAIMNSMHIEKLAELVETNPFYYNDIKNYSHTLQTKLYEDISRNVLKTNGYFSLFIHELNTSYNKKQWLSLIPSIFKNSIEYEEDNDPSRVAMILSEIVVITQKPRYVIDIMYIQDFIPSLFYVLTNWDKYAFYPNQPKRQIFPDFNGDIIGDIIGNILEMDTSTQPIIYDITFITNCIDILSSILDSHYDSYGDIMLKYGILYLSEDLGDRFAKKMWKLYAKLFRNPKKRHVDLITNDNDTLESVLKVMVKIPYSLVKLLKVSTDDQIELLVKQMMKYKFREDLSLNDGDLSISDVLLNRNLVELWTEYNRYCKEGIQQESSKDSNTIDIYDDPLWGAHHAVCEEYVVYEEYPAVDESSSEDNGSVEQLFANESSSEDEGKRNKPIENNENWNDFGDFDF